MTRSRIAPTMLSILTVVFALAAVWLAFDNPDIDNTSRGNGYTCAAPYDAVLNDADNFPGGETPADADEIASRCSEAGQQRFYLAVGSGTAAALTAAITLWAAHRRDGARSQADSQPAPVGRAGS